MRTIPDNVRLIRATTWIAVTMATLVTAFPCGAGTSSLTTEHIKNEPRVGDFDMMTERRTIRVLVPYSRTLYFSDKGHERGITAETARDFERYLNQKHRCLFYTSPSPRDRQKSR